MENNVIPTFTWFQVYLKGYRSVLSVYPLNLVWDFGSGDGDPNVGPIRAHLSFFNQTCCVQFKRNGKGWRSHTSLFNDTDGFLLNHQETSFQQASSMFYCENRDDSPLIYADFVTQTSTDKVREENHGGTEARRKAD
jgi:hypothetical protein